MTLQARECEQEKGRIPDSCTSKTVKCRCYIVGRFGMVGAGAAAAGGRIHNPAKDKVTGGSIDFSCIMFK
ncbi:MAG TPA: hypothetical protein VF172_12055 [Nitrososphaera sp.]